MCPLPAYLSSLTQSGHMKNICFLSEMYAWVLCLPGECGAFTALALPTFPPQEAGRFRLPPEPLGALSPEKPCDLWIFLI